MLLTRPANLVNPLETFSRIISFIEDNKSIKFVDKVARDIRLKAYEEEGLRELFKESSPSARENTYQLLKWLDDITKLLKASIPEDFIFRDGVSGAKLDGSHLGHKMIVTKHLNKNLQHIFIGMDIVAKIFSLLTEVFEKNMPRDNSLIALGESIRTVLEHPMMKTKDGQDITVSRFMNQLGINTDWLQNLPEEVVPLG